MSLTSTDFRYTYGQRREGRAGGGARTSTHAGTNPKDTRRWRVRDSACTRTAEASIATTVCVVNADSSDLGVDTLVRGRG